MNRYSPFFLGGMSLLLCGCVFTPKPDLSQFYVLSPQCLKDTAAPAAMAPIVLASLELPKELESSKIASRFGATLLYYDAEHRWAAPLRSLVQEALEGYLKEHGYLCVHHADADTPQLHIQVKAFCAGPDDNVVLQAQWFKGTPQHPGARYQATIREPYALYSHNYPALTEAMAQALSALAAEVAKSLEEGPPAARDASLDP